MKAHVNLALNGELMGLQMSFSPRRAARLIVRGLGGTLEDASARDEGDRYKISMREAIVPLFKVRKGKRSEVMYTWDILRRWI